MKKLMFLLLALPFMLMSCSDDDKDLPKVNISVDFSGGEQVDGTIYIVQGDSLYINSVTATPVREGKNVAISAVTYYVDGWMMGYNPVAPFGAMVNTGNLSVGKHVLALSMPVLEVGCEIATGTVIVPLVVVPTEADLPAAGPTPGVITTGPTFDD